MNMVFLKPTLCPLSTVKAFPFPNGTRAEFILRIEDACREMRRNNRGLIRKSVRNILRRARKYLNQNGGHFEQIL